MDAHEVDEQSEFYDVAPLFHQKVAGQPQAEPPSEVPAPSAAWVTRSAVLREESMYLRERITDVESARDEHPKDSQAWRALNEPLNAMRREANRLSLRADEFAVEPQGEPSSEVPEPSTDDRDPITDENLWDFADDLLDAWNIEDANAPSLAEDFRDRFVARFHPAYRPEPQGEPSSEVPEPSAEVLSDWFTSSHGVAVAAVKPMTDRGPSVMVDGRVISPNDVAALIEFKAQGEPSDVIDLDRLESLAKAATPGPWDFIFDGPTQEEDGSWYEPTESGVRSDIWDNDFPHADAEFIAATDPQTVLALIAALRAASSVTKGENREERHER